MDDWPVQCWLSYFTILHVVNFLAYWRIREYSSLELHHLFPPFFPPPAFIFWSLSNISINICKYIEKSIQKTNGYPSKTELFGNLYRFRNLHRFLYKNLYRFRNPCRLQKLILHGFWFRNLCRFPLTRMNESKKKEPLMGSFFVQNLGN